MKHPLLFLLLLLSFSSCTSSQLFSDFKQDTESPAFNEEMIIDIEGHSVAAYAFIANGPVPKETIILIHGYPGNDNSFDVATALRRTGRNVIHFYSRGAWGNQGEYLYSNGLTDIDAVIDFLSLSANTKRLRIRPDAFVLLGRSYGGGLALIQGSKNDRVKKIIAVTSVNYGHIMEGYKDLSELGGFKKYMKKQFMINTDIDAFLQEMLDNKQAFNVLSYKDQLKKKKVLVIEDTDKNDTWLKSLGNVKVVKMKTDHGFIDKRIELIELMAGWLDDE